MSESQARAWGASGDHSPLMNNYGSPSRTFVVGDGCHVWDKLGFRYLDFLCGIAVTSLGHCHRDVNEAISIQLSKITHTSNLFANEHQAIVAQEINRLIDAGSGQVLFQNSGAEANEAAIKLARKHQGKGRHVVVSALRSFHGRTLATLAATGQPEKHEPFEPLPEGFRHVAFNDVEALKNAITPEVGAVLLESVQGEGGVYPATTKYLREARQLCDENNVLLIMDEIQTGFARTGEWFGYQHSGIQPDLVTLAKAIANGMPVGALWARDEVAASFSPGDHGSTFAGQALALAAARATIDAYVDMEAPLIVRHKEAKLRTRLSNVSGIKEIRGRGLLLALELRQECLAGSTAKEVARECLDARLIVNAITPSALRIAPPYIVRDQEMDEATEILDAVLNSRMASVS